MTERFSASRAAKHLACPASANLELAIPGWVDPPEAGETAASTKGTSMHAILEHAGSFTPKEMLAMAQAMEYVARLRMTRRFKIELEAEGSGWWLTGKPKTKADVVLYVSDEIHIIDYKFGRIPVDVDDNPQMFYYALSFVPYAPKATGVWVHVVQPLIGNIESVFITAEELELFRLRTIEADKKIQAKDLTFAPSDACKFCPANPHSRGGKGSPYCPAMMQMLYPHHTDVDAVLDEDI